MSARRGKRIDVMVLGERIGVRRGAYGAGRSRYDVVMMGAIIARDFAPSLPDAIVRTANALPIANATTVAGRKRSPMEELPDA